MCYKYHTLTRGVAAALLAATISTAAAAAPAPGGESAQAFVARLLGAISSGNRRAVGGMFRYPLRVNAEGLPPIPLDNAASTLQLYDLLFTPEMRCALEQAQPPQAGQPLPKYPLLTAGDALTLAGGVLVAERTAGTFRITRLTVIGTPAPRSSRRGEPQRTEQIDLKFKGTVRQAAGNLAGDAVDRYTVSMTQGSLLQAKLERFRGLGAVLRVTDVKAQAVDAKADGRRTWAGVMPASGDYRVDVVRKAPFCDPPLTYLLTLTTR